MQLSPSETAGLVLLQLCFSLGDDVLIDTHRLGEINGLVEHETPNLVGG